MLGVTELSDFDVDGRGADVIAGGSLSTASPRSRWIRAGLRVSMVCGETAVANA